MKTPLLPLKISPLSLFFLIRLATQTSEYSQISTHSKDDRISTQIRSLKSNHSYLGFEIDHGAI